MKSPPSALKNPPKISKNNDVKFPNYEEKLKLFSSMQIPETK
jgi:hypothetical protein